MKPPKGTDLGDNILKVVRPLYGILEAGNHWYKTYHDHHTNQLKLQVSTFDPCLLFSEEAIVGMQTDDTLFAGTESFIKREEEQAAFPAKDVEQLTEQKNILFNGSVISTTNDILNLSQERQCGKIKLVDEMAIDRKTPYVEQRAHMLQL